MTVAAAVLLANIYRTIGLTLAVFVGIGAVVYVAVNARYSGRAEIGSEIELAANRKPYYDDEFLEGPKLDRVLTLALLTLFVLAAGIPFYWIMEPGRQANAAGDFNRKFVDRGAALFAPADEGGFGCATCHGGVTGGRVTYNLTDPITGSVTQVQWRAPALNTVLLRFDRTELTFILTYGRPGTPMPAWGVAGGGAMNDQQIQNLIDYLESEQISAADSQTAVAAELVKYRAATDETGAPLFDNDGAALFNMGILDGFAGGSYSCGRCHTEGWSRSTLSDQVATAPDGHMVVSRAVFDAALENAGCGGGFAPSLCDGASQRQFPDPQDQTDFVTLGSETGKGYGRFGQGDGRMPGFGASPAEAALFWINHGQARDPGAGMLTPDMVSSIVAYERGLTSTDNRSAATAGTTTATTSTIAGTPTTASPTTTSTPAPTTTLGGGTAGATSTTTNSGG